MNPNDPNDPNYNHPDMEDDGLGGVPDPYAEQHYEEEAPQEVAQEAYADPVPEGDYAPESQGEAEVAEGMLPSISLPVIVALGRSYMSIKDIIKLQPGQILELNKNPNEPVDLVVNGKVVARGELVDVDGRLAIRLIKILD